MTKTKQQKATKMKKPQYKGKMKMALCQSTGNAPIAASIAYNACGGASYSGFMASMN